VGAWTTLLFIQHRGALLAVFSRFLDPEIYTPSEVLGSDQVQRIRGLPLHQKLLLVALMRRGRSLTEVEARKVRQRLGETKLFSGFC
jgi:hypothetical protein